MCLVLRNNIKLPIALKSVHHTLGPQGSTETGPLVETRVPPHNLRHWLQVRVDLPSTRRGPPQAQLNDVTRPAIPSTLTHCEAAIPPLPFRLLAAQLPVWLFQDTTVTVKLPLTILSSTRPQQLPIPAAPSTSLTPVIHESSDPAGFPATVGVSQYFLPQTAATVRPASAKYTPAPAKFSLKGSSPSLPRSLHLCWSALHVSRTLHSFGRSGIYNVSRCSGLNAENTVRAALALGQCARLDTSPDSNCALDPFKRTRYHHSNASRRIPRDGHRSLPSTRLYDRARPW
jgi:hypothetical protein